MLRDMMSTPTMHALIRGKGPGHFMATSHTLHRRFSVAFTCLRRGDAQRVALTSALAARIGRGADTLPNGCCTRRIGDGSDVRGVAHGSLS